MSLICLLQDVQDEASEIIDTIRFVCDISMTIPTALFVLAWFGGNALVSINVVTVRRARLIVGWVIISG